MHTVTMKTTMTTLLRCRACQHITLHRELENVAWKYHVMAAPPNTDVETTTRRSQQLSLYHAAKFGWYLLLECSAVTLPIQENARLGRKVNFALGKIPLRGNSPPKCICSVPAQETAKHLGWPSLSDVGAVTKPRRETCWNFLGCSKLANRSQPLVSRSSPYCEDMWSRYCHLTNFFDCRYVPSLRRYSPTNLCDGAQIAIFCAIFASCIFSEPRVAHFRPAY